jgi:hypothetical protein
MTARSSAWSSTSEMHSSPRPPEPSVNLRPGSPGATVSISSTASSALSKDRAPPSTDDAIWDMSIDRTTVLVNSCNASSPRRRSYSLE